MGLRPDPCTEDVIEALLAELRGAAATDANAASVLSAAQTHVDQLRVPYDPTWTIQALDGVIRQMNTRGFRHVVARVVGGSSCTPAQMASFRLEPLTDRSDY